MSKKLDIREKHRIWYCMKELNTSKIRLEYGEMCFKIKQKFKEDFLGTKLI